MNALEIDDKTQEQDNLKPPAHLRKILVAICIARMAVITPVSGLSVAQPMPVIEFKASQSIVDD